MWFIMFWFVGTAVGIVTGIENPGMRSLQSICSNLLLYQLTITVAATGLWCFIGHVFKSEMVAQSIGWKPSLFQKELGYCELGIGLCGILCIWMGREFWLSTIIIFCSLFIGAAILHMKEIKEKGNMNPGNVITVIPDLLIPFSLIILYFCT